MIRAAILALAYFGMIAALLATMGLHHNVPWKLAAIVLTMGAVVSFIVFIDETRQQRRKWRDHPSRRAGIIKDWNE